MYIYQTLVIDKKDLNPSQMKICSTEGLYQSLILENKPSSREGLDGRYHKTLKT